MEKGESFRTSLDVLDLIEGKAKIDPAGQIVLRKFFWEIPMRSTLNKIYASVAVLTFALLFAWSLNTSARAEQLSCSLLIDSLESNITLSLKTAETLLADLSADIQSDGTLVGEIESKFLTNYISLANLVWARTSLVLEDLNAMNQIGPDCIEVGHFKTVIGQAKNANNIDQYLHEKFTSASSETSVFLTIATARSLLSRAINHKKNVLSNLVAEGYFLQ